jgi:hypothetical protein
VSTAKPQTTTQRRTRFDAASQQRLTWIQHMLRKGLNLAAQDAQQHVIVRRALECYAVHLETILKLPPGHDVPQLDRDLAAYAERNRLATARTGQDLGVSDEAITALPVRPLSAIVADHVKALPQVPSPMEWIRAQNARSDAKAARKGAARLLGMGPALNLNIPVDNEDEHGNDHDET